MSFDQSRMLALQLSRDYNPQDDCLLLKMIPLEIQFLIFKFALTAYDGLPYGKGTFYDRPGYHHAHRIDTELLRTCRLVYLKCYLLPVKLNEIVMWCGGDRGPPQYESRGTNGFPATLEQMTVSRFHFFMQQMWLEHQWTRLSPMVAFNPSVIHFTIRYTHWWDWEHERALHLDPKQTGQAQKPFCGEIEQFSYGSWGDAFRHLHGLRQFVLELETVESKRAELDEIIARAAGWRFPLRDGNLLVLDEARTVHSTWMGLDRFDGKPSQPDDSPAGRLRLDTYQTPKLKPQIVEMAEDFLNAQEASLCKEFESSDIQGAGTLAPTSPLTSNLESPGQALIGGHLASNTGGSKAMTSEIAHKIIAEVQNIQGYEPDELVRIYSYVQTDLTEEQVKIQAYGEMEDMLALHYRVVTLTWIAKPGPVERAATT